MNIFFSYPHDDNVEFVKRLKLDLEARGHTVWFDETEIKTGDDWRSKITRGILESETVVAFLSKHAVRDPGVCLNEIAIALAEKGDEAIVTVLVEPEKNVSAPVSITHIQWLKMEDHLTQSADDGWYRTHFDKLVEVIEHPSSATRHEELGKLKDVLNPLSFNADIAFHLPRFTGRQWLVGRYEDWLSKPSPGNANKVFRIEGGPGMGKTAVASYLAHATKSSVLGVHLCKSGSAITHNPGQLVLSLAYQMATRLPDFRARLLKVPCIKNPDLMKDEDAGSLWDMLISEPLAGAGKSGLIDRQRLAIVIDGLDEATKNGQNPIVEMLADHIQTLPSWVGVVLTGRPDPELTQSLKHYTPQVINGDDPANMEDLRHYIDDWLQDEVKSKRLQAHQVQPAAQALLKKSEGAFLYLVQAREEALQSNEDGSKSYDLSNPATLPSGLNALYQKSFRRMFPDVQSDPDNPATRWNALVKPLLSYILASPEALPLDLARELMGWDTDTTGNEKQHKALQALGSLVKRSGDVSKPETCTLAPFHNSVREWLTSENSQAFRVFAESSIYPLAQATWKRYLQSMGDNVYTSEINEFDPYAWQVLPSLLSRLSENEQDGLLGESSSDTGYILSSLADSMESKLRYTEAYITCTVLAHYSQRLCNTAPENAKFARDLSISYDRLGNTLTCLGKIDEALGYRQRSLKIRESLSERAPESAQLARDLAHSFNCVGGTLYRLGRTDEALDYYQQQLKILEDLSERAPEDAQFAIDLSYEFTFFGKILKSMGKTEEALVCYQRGLKIAEALSENAPEKTEFSYDQCMKFFQRGIIALGLRKYEEALGCYQRGLKIAEELSEKDPDSDLFANLLSSCYTSVGNTLTHLERTNEALGYYQRCLKIAENWNARAPENAEYANRLFDSITSLGDTLASQGKTDEALEYYQRCLKIAEDLSARAPANAELALDLPDKFETLGTALAKLGKSDEALGCYLLSLKIHESLCDSAPENVLFARDLFVNFDRLGNTLASLGKTDEALCYYQRGQKIAEDLSQHAPENAQFASDLSMSYSRLGNTLANLGKTDEALGCFQLGLKIAEDLSERIPENAEFAYGLSSRYEDLGNILAFLGKTDAALDYFQQGLKILEDLSEREPENTEFANELCGRYWGYATIATGEEQTSILRKSLSTLMSMQARGILAKSDEKFIAAVKAKLGLE